MWDRTGRNSPKPDAHVYNENGVEIVVYNMKRNPKKKGDEKKDRKKKRKLKK